MENQKLTGRQGAKPLLSLDGVCPCLICRCLLSLGDWVLSWLWRTDGHGILKGSIARRVALRLRAIGLKRSHLALERRYGSRRGRGRSLLCGPELDLRMPGGSSCACDEKKGVKCFTHMESRDLADYVPVNGIGSPAFHVGEN